MGGSEVIVGTTTAGEEFCDICGTLNLIVDSDYGFYRCEKCDRVWARDEDDPDYYEAEPCPACNGTGRMNPYGIEACGECDGTGEHY